MCALFPPSFGWPSMEDLVCRDSDNTIEGSLEFLQASDAQQAELIDRSASFSGNSSGGDPSSMVIKKLYHNASERDRRKKINTLYSSLRSLLPRADQTKKLSIPATVSRVLKYIPELRRHVERLIGEKEELLMKIRKQRNNNSHNHNHHHHHHKLKSEMGNGSLSLASISANKLGDMEILVQVSSYNKINKCPLLSEILLNLEEDGLLLLNASSFESQDGRVFYCLHLQAETTSRLDCEIVTEKLKALHNERIEDLFPSKFL